MSIRVVVVDDEPLGRRGIVSRLNRRDDVDVVAQCAHARDAIAAIKAAAPDLVFLDIQMPGGDGFAVVDELAPNERPHVIFVTAYDRHALRAFEAHALDYLLKPIDDERFNEAVDRAIATIQSERESEVWRRAVLSAASDGAVRAADRYPVRTKGKIVFLRHAEIDWIEAEGDYVRIHAGKSSWLVRDRIGRVERELGGRRFARIHRSTIVALDRIREVRTLETGDDAVVLRDGTELRLGRSYRSVIEQMTGTP
jgi:two-component system LytT family response regulator